MAGVLLVIGTITWIIACAALAKHAARAQRLKNKNTTSSVLIFLVLLFAPIMDQLIGSAQFNALCKQLAPAYVNPNIKPFSTLRLKSEVVQVSGVAIPIKKKITRYVDDRSNSVVAEYATIRTQNGLLWRTLFSLDGPGSYCDSPGRMQMHKSLKSLIIY